MARSPRIAVMPSVLSNPSWWTRSPYSLLPSSSSSTPDLSKRSPLRRRLIQASAGALGLVVLLSMYGVHRYRRNDSYSQWEAIEGSGTGSSTEDSTSWVGALPTEDTQWGMSEEQGWEEPPFKGLADLGDIAEERYRLGPTDEADYFGRLYDFIFTLPDTLHIPLLGQLSAHLPPDRKDLLPEPKPWTQAPAMISYKTIHQTDKKFGINDETQMWINLNEKDGWQLNFLDDDGAERWAERWFDGTDVMWAWHYMHRGVLKADFLRYLLPLVEGGVYSDVDTRPLRPIEQWGHLNVEYLDLTMTDGPEWRRSLATYPSVLVAIDVDVHHRPHWEDGWPRPLGICQWTLSSAPHHPILLDAVRRVVNATKVVQEWDEWRFTEVARLRLEGMMKEADDLEKQGKDHIMPVMEWTGPGLFSDSVLAFLKARYHVTWHRLRALSHPLRIGDVLIMPITAFSPGGEADFGAEGPDSPQADVLHDFRGSWKGDGL